MKITVITVGKIKEKYLKDAIAELQRSAQLRTEPGVKSMQVSEGVKSMIDYLRTGSAPTIQYDMAGIKSATVSNPPNGGYFAVPEFQNRVIIGDGGSIVEVAQFSAGTDLHEIGGSGGIQFEGAGFL